MLLAGEIVGWGSRKQSAVAFSTAEAERIAYKRGCSERCLICVTRSRPASRCAATAAEDFSAHLAHGGSYRAYALRRPATAAAQLAHDGNCRAHVFALNVAKTNSSDTALWARGGVVMESPGMAIVRSVVG